MNYELAKELKDAGFPQTGRSDWYCGGHTYYDSYPEGERHEECAEKTILTRGDLYCDSASMTAEFPIEVPTLSELIEACGAEKDNFTLISFPSLGKWVATLDSLTTGFGKGNGATPEEAVALLYLALNRKE